MSHYPLLPAYICSGNQWVVWCPACGHLHRHQAVPGHREADCYINNPIKQTGYLIVPTGIVVSESVLALDYEGQKRVKRHLKRIHKKPYVPLPIPQGYQELSQKESLIKFLEWTDVNVTDPDELEEAIDYWITKITKPLSSFYPRFIVGNAQTRGTLAFTLDELAQLFQVSSRTICRWLARYPEFREAVGLKNEPGDRVVEDAFFEIAAGRTVKQSRKEITNAEGAARIEKLEETLAEVLACTTSGCVTGTSSGKEKTAD